MFKCRQALPFFAMVAVVSLFPVKAFASGHPFNVDYPDIYQKKSIKTAHHLLKDLEHAGIISHAQLTGLLARLGNNDQAYEQPAATTTLSLLATQPLHLTLPEKSRLASFEEIDRLQQLGLLSSAEARSLEGRLNLVTNQRSIQ